MPFYFLQVFASNIPLHRFGSPLHVPLGRHVLMVDPLRMNPWSQLNTTLLGNTVESPEEEPLIGTGKGPQSTATNIFIKRKDLEE